jgi:hypothetical protein
MAAGPAVVPVGTGPGALTAAGSLLRPFAGYGYAGAVVTHLVDAARMAAGPAITLFVQACCCLLPAHRVAVSVPAGG